MRTTVTLDPDVEALVKKVMRERGLTFKQALNDAIRNGLASSKSSKRFRTPTYDMGVFEIPGHKVLQFAAELEDEEILRQMRLREANAAPRRRRRASG